jgi:hypothetical protein
LITSIAILAKATIAEKSETPLTQNLVDASLLKQVTIANSPHQLDLEITSSPSPDHKL